MATGYFPEVKNQVTYEGPDTKNPLAYRYYRPERQVMGKPMSEHLKFAVSYWHTMRGTGSDPFGGGVYKRTWWEGSDAVKVAESTCDALFEFVQKLGISHYCFHDRDMSPEGKDAKETAAIFERLVRRAEQRQADTGVKLLWGTANLFSHPRYTHGAATNPDPAVFACAANQVKYALEATHRLGGTGYVFWGGREGYSSLLNTDYKRERELMARFFHMAVDHAKRIGFQGMFFIEPKPMEPTSHQYDFDTSASLNFLREFNLWDNFMLNIETNHAWLAGHTMESELTAASAAGKLGSLDINQGNPMLGWDTDQFPTDLGVATWASLILLKQGGLKYGGLNFDAKVRRGSFDSEDLFHAHIGGIDTFAKALLISEQMIKDRVFTDFVDKRYEGYRTGVGSSIWEGTTSLDQLAQYAESHPEPTLRSGKEELLENTFRNYLIRKDIE